MELGGRLKNHGSATNNKKSGNNIDYFTNYLEINLER